MSIPRISVVLPNVPKGPDSSDPDNFDPEADAFLGAVPALATAMNTLASQANALAQGVDAAAGQVASGVSTATDKATAATTSATNAATSETNALASKNAAATSATNATNSATAAAASAAIADGVPRTTGTTKGDLIAYTSAGVPVRLGIGTEGQVLRVLPAAGAGIAWGYAPFVDTSSEVSVTAAITLTAAACGKMHVCTGTTADYTVGLPAASGNAGKLIGIRIAQACTKLVTLDANAAELIDGATTRVMWAGESAILLCDGSGWTKIAGKSIPMQCQLSATAAQTIASGTFATMRMDAVVFDKGSISVLATNKMVVKREGVYVINAFAEISTYVSFLAIISIGTWRTSLSGGASFSGVSGIARIPKGQDVFGIISHSTGSNVATAGQFASILASEVPEW